MQTTSLGVGQWWWAKQHNQPPVADDVGFTRIVAASSEVHVHPIEADNAMVKGTTRVIEVAMTIE